ncbi:MAG: DUF2225 domain-containing protein [Lachnospiraceae bacterium]|nr:DUF2225 domain-containing protein [Lachnospiraceae bacterium]
MSNLLSGLGKFGLGNLQEMKLFEEPEEKKSEAKEAKPKAPEEEEFLLSKSFECPVCYEKFNDLVMRSGKARLIGSDRDLRPRYENIDPIKYGVISCPNCGFSVLSRYFAALSPTIAKLIKTNISDAFIKRTDFPSVYTYENAFERHQLCLANAIVKRAKDSEKADICWKTAWVLRGMAETLDKTEADYETKLKEIQAQEQSFLKHAFDGFINARTSENYPISGMDESTLDYLLATLAINFKQFDVASRMISGILASPSANARIKEKARDLKEELKK